MRYGTIVADPPWNVKRPNGWGANNNRSMPYPTMSVSELESLPVRDLAAPVSHLYLWTVGAYLEQSYSVARAWGFRPVIPLIWCKPVTGKMLGGHFTPTAEFVLFCRKGSEAVRGCKGLVDRSWFEWPRAGQSVKPEAFLDMVERVSPEPRLEMFARRQRLGWHTWGNEALEHVSLA